MKKSAILLVLSFYLIALPVGVIAHRAEVYAQNSNGQKCESVQAKLQERVDKFADIKNNRSRRYQNIYDKTQTLVDRLEDQEIDTSQIRTDARQLKGKVEILVADATVYETALNHAKEVACDGNERLRPALEKTRNAIRQLAQDAKDIEDFYKLTIRPDLLDLKNQLENSSE